MLAPASLDEGLILDAASRVLARDGVDGFTLEAIAADVGASREQLAGRFDDESALFHSLVRRSFKNVGDRMIAAVAASADGSEALTRVVRVWVEYYLARPDEFRQTFILAQVLPPGTLGIGDVAESRIHQQMIGVPLDALEAKLRADRGVAQLPAGIDPRRLAFSAIVTAMGFLNTLLAAQAWGSNLRHGADVMIAELSRALGAPFVVMRQLAALNEVAASLARIRMEAELRAAVPSLLESVIDVDDAGLAVSEQGGVLGDQRIMPAVARRAFAEGRTLHEELLKEEGSSNEKGTRAVIIATPIRYEGKPEAVVWGVSLSSSSALDERDIARLETFASMVGLALENVRLYENLQAQLDARTRTLSEAHVRLAEATQMAALGKMVAGVAHELNTPVASVLSSGSTAMKAAAKLRGLPAGTGTGTGTPAADSARLFTILEESVGVMTTGAARVGSVVEQLKRFARLDAAEVERMDVNVAVKDAIALLKSEIAPTCTVAMDLADDVPLVTCYASRINNVLLNVIRNAAQAIGGRGGNIRITTTTTTGQSPTDDSTITIVVEDDGSGIAPDDLRNVHDPVFTAKGGRVRAGLGLATSKQIMHDHRGELRIESEQGKGTRVTIVLPIALSQKR